MAVFASIPNQVPSPAADKENFTSSAPHPKAAAVVASVHALAGRRRRARASGSPSSAQYAVHQAARRQTRSPPVRTSFTATRDVEMTDAISFTASVESSKVKITFPASLQRPAFRPISSETLASLDPEFAKVPIEYVQDKLRAAGSELLRSVSITSAAPCSGLPKEIEVLVNDVVDDVPIPTHMLAVFTKDKPRAGRRRQIKLFPVHQVVLAANCAHLPAFPPSTPLRPTAAGDSTTLPVVTLCVPNTTTFPILQHYLYTKRTEVLLASLLPAPNVHIPVEQTPQYLAATYTPSVLTAHLLRVHALWSNVCVLGVFDDKLWRAIDMAWEVLMTALAHAGPSGVAAESH